MMVKGKRREDIRGKGFDVRENEGEKGKNVRRKRG
jgi:hypothetical protein